MSHVSSPIPRQTDALESENAALRLENVNLRHQLALAECANIRLESNRSLAVQDTHSYQSRIGSLTSQLRQSTDHQKAELQKIESAQQQDRSYYSNQITKLQNELSISKEANQELKSLFVKRNRECRDIELHVQNELEKCKTDERRMLTSAGLYFHTFFPSIISLEEYFAIPKQSLIPEKPRKKHNKRIHTQTDILRKEHPTRLREIDTEKDNLRQEQKSRLREIETENQQLKDELRNSQPTLFWQDVEVIGLPPDLRETLATVIDSDLLSLQSKFQHCFKALIGFYDHKMNSLSGQYERSQQISESIAGKLSPFLETLAFETLYQSVANRDLLTDDSIHNQILDAIKKLKGEFKESLVVNQRLQRSFPAEELAILRETVDDQKKQIEERITEIGELKRQLKKPRNEIEELKAEIAKALHEKEFYEQELHAVKGAIRHQETLKETVAKQKLKIERLENELNEREESEKKGYSKELSDLQFGNAVSERELSFIHGNERGSPHDDRKVEITAMRRQLEVSEVSDKKIRKMQRKLEQLQCLLEEERAANVQKLKEARMKTIEEYAALVQHLRARCDEQKATIESLLEKRNAKRRTATP
jgi:hypothetical protein